MFNLNQHIKSERTKKATKNIIYSFILKGGSIAISFFLVPLTLDYLNSFEYGIWLTLSSILSWIYSFDIGIGNGLRNKLTEAIAKDDFKIAKIYISTTFFSLGILVIFFFFIFILCQNWLNWYSILNVGTDSVHNLNNIVSLVFSFICINFFFRIIGTIYMAYQIPSANDLLSFFGNLFSLIVIYISTKTLSASLSVVACALAGVPALIYLIAYPITFIRFPQIKPSFKNIDLHYFKPLVNLGFKFFILQVSALIIFATSNVLISQLFGPQEVTTYNISFKLYSVFTIGFTIILGPFWSAITDALTRNEVNWVKNILKHLLRIWGGMVVSVIAVTLISPWIYKIWVGDEIQIPLSFSIVCAIYVIISNWNAIFSTAINATGTLFISFTIAILQALIFIPLAIFLSHYMGPIGILASLCLALSISMILSPIQLYKLLNGKGRGLWIK